MNSSATYRVEDKLEELLLAWEEVHEQGQNLPAEELCADCPELISALQQRIDVLLKMEKRLGASGSMNGSEAGEPKELKGTVDLNTSYTVLRQHAAGGLGEVYLAHDTAFQREVAVKTLKDICMQATDRRVRFLREAQITGQLEHPGIVPVYGLGTSSDGKPIYSMRFIRGESLDEAIQECFANGTRRANIRPLLRHFISACRTVHYAHSRRILHCDLKPLNIMVGKFGETFVLDWGEAVVINAHTLATEGPVPAARDTGVQTDSPAGGTIPYMPPERIDGKGTALDATSDVYSLGATLYKVLTGREALRASTRQELVDRILSGDFPRAHEVNTWAPKTLSQICAKAMAVKREDRYESAGRLADDIQAWMDDEPVSFRRESWNEWLARMSRRHRAAAMVTLVTLVAAVLGVSAFAMMSSRNAQERQAALDKTRAAYEETASARESGLRALARFAAAQIEEDIERKWKTLESAAKHPDLPGWIRQANEQQQQVPAMQAWLGNLYAEHREDLHASSWFVLGPTGLQVGRFPEGLFAERMNNYAYKTYFHGEGQEYDPDTPHPALRQPSLSPVFWSGSDKCRKIAFSVPIWDETRSMLPAGVLVMTVKLGDIDLLDIQVDDDEQPVTVETDHVHRHALLIDLRQDWNDRRGTILQHPLFHEERLNPDKAPLISEPLLMPLEVERNRTVPSIHYDFADPILNEVRLAAVAPVRVRGAGIGWLAVVTERPTRVSGEAK